MKHCLVYTLLSLSLLGPLSADVFFLGRNYDAATRTFSPNPDVAMALEGALGKVPAYSVPNAEESDTLQLLYGRLLGVIKGDAVETGMAGYTFSDDSLRVEVITHSNIRASAQARPSCHGDRYAMGYRTFLWEHCRYV